MPGWSSIRCNAGIPCIFVKQPACKAGTGGPRLPDAGLFREVSVLAVKLPVWHRYFVGQEHHVTGKPFMEMWLTSSA